MAPHGLRSMRLSKAKKTEQTQPALSHSPEYPYGLRLSLDQDALKKLGISSLPKAGSTVTLHAKAFVASVSQSEQDGSTPQRSMEVQITDLELAPSPSSRDFWTRMKG